MTQLFTAHESLSDVPPPTPGWITLGLGKSGQIHDFGLSRKMTMGERLLGKYKKFFHVNMTPQTKVVEVTALSATGRYEFPVRIEVDFKVADAAELVGLPDAVETLLLRPLRRLVFPEAKTTAAADFEVLEARLGQQIDPKRGGPSRYGVFEVVDVAVDVQPPAGYTLASGEMDDIANLELRTTASLARGEKDKADNLETARRHRDSFKYSTLDAQSEKLDKLRKVMEQRMNLLNEGHVSPELIAQIDREIEELGGVPPALEHEKGDAKPSKKPRSEPEEFGDTD